MHSVELAVVDGELLELATRNLPAAAVLSRRYQFS